MNKHPYRSMIVVAAMGLTTLLVLVYASTHDPRTNGFNRNFVQTSGVTPLDTLDIEFDSYYIAGQSQAQLYLGNLVAPRNLLVVEPARLDTQHVILALDNPKHLKFWNVMVKVDSPFIYLMDGAVPALFQGTLSGRQMRYTGEGIPYFLDFLPTQKNAFAIRSINSLHEAELGKVYRSSFSRIFYPELLEKQVDGVFCTEGTMHYSNEHHTLIYLYAYRNQFLVMDSSMHLLFRGNTIDTVSTAHMEVTSVSSSRAMTFASPPVMVNYHSALWKDYLLVHSALMADNEEINAFEKASVIDVYRITNGKYSFSFYIPYHDRKPLRNFRIVKNTLMVLYERHVISYGPPQSLNQRSAHNGNTE